MTIKLTREEAIQDLKAIKSFEWYARGRLALDIAIEALKGAEINCVHCPRYFETEDETGVHSHCEDLISRAEAIRKVASYIWHLPNSVYPHFNGYNVIENFVMDALSALPSADRPRSIDPTIEVDLESGVVPRSACEPRGTKTIVYENNEKSKHKMKKPAKPDEAIEVTKKAPEKAPLGVTSGVKDGRDVIMVPTDRLDEFIEKESKKRSNIAPTSAAEEFQRRLARSIAEAGRWLMDNAEGISGSVEGRRSLDIHLSWECSGNEIAPTINIDSDFICREAIAEMHRKEIEK